LRTLPRRVKNHTPADTPVGPHAPDAAVAALITHAMCIIRWAVPGIFHVLCISRVLNPTPRQWIILFTSNGIDDLSLVGMIFAITIEESSGFVGLSADHNYTETAGGTVACGSAQTAGDARGKCIRDTFS